MCDPLSLTRLLAVDSNRSNEGCLQVRRIRQKEGASRHCFQDRLKAACMRAYGLSAHRKCLQFKAAVNLC